jgi:hypothetical protein
MPPTVYQSSLRRTVLLALAALGFVAASVWLLASHRSIRAEVAGAVGLPFFALAAAALIYRLIRRRPELVITDDGFAHRTWGRVAWSDVRAVGIREIRVRNTSRRMIEVVLHDPDAHVSAAPVAARTLMRVNQRAGYRPINLSAVTLPVPLTDVLAAMKRHQPNLVVATGDQGFRRPDRQGWTDDLSVPLPPGRTVTELVDAVLRSALRAEPAEDMDRLLAVEFGLSAEDAELARDRCFGGLVRAATRNPLNCPAPDKDPVAWESFQRGLRDPSLVASIYPDLA